MTRSGRNVDYSVQPFTAADLNNENFLAMSLQERVPMGQQLSMIQHGDIDRSRYDETLTHFIAGWMQCVTGRGEEGLISRDDALCNIFCKLAHLEKFSRNKHEDSTVFSTRSDRTDFWNGVPIVTTEEKDDSIQEASDDIKKKRRWIPNYHHIPFTFGIAFSRDSLKIFTLNRNGTEEKVFDAQFDNLVERWSCVVAAINIARTLLYFQQDGMMIPSTMRYGVWHDRQFKKLRLGVDCCEIELKDAALYGRLCDIYDTTLTAHVTHMEHLHQGRHPFNHVKHRISLQPVGIQRRPTQAEAITAITHIFQCLFQLHAVGIVHCDIRWGNVIEAFGEWYLIDFEFACRLNEEQLLSIRSAETIRAKHVLNQSLPWSPCHDLYQVGVLLQDILDLDLPAGLVALCEFILSKNFTYDQVVQLVGEL